jgi:exopolysaccharide biosynthesis polyprenyl glycosylphosphotransferase
MPSARKQAFSIQALQLVDALLVWLAYVLADLIRDPHNGLLGKNGPMTWVLYITVPFTPLVLEYLGFYDRQKTRNSLTIFSQLIRGLLTVTLLISTYSLFTKIDGGSRIILVISPALQFIFLTLRYKGVQWYGRSRGVHDKFRERVLMAGSGDQTTRFLKDLDSELLDDWTIVGYYDFDNDTMDDLYRMLKTYSVSRVVFCPLGTEFGKLSEAVEACELQGVEAWISSSFIRTQIARPTFDSIGEKPMLVLRSTPELSWELFIKGVFDRIGAAIAIMLTLPLWIVAIIGIRLTSPGAPVFFAQKRAGRYGRPFRMWKFRTMVPNAEQLLQQIKDQHGNQMSGPVFKLDQDPRVFKFGGLLRKLSIDELPQLLNVLKGDMSLVGPRPLPLYEVDAFEKSAHRRRLSVKPGITCEWQAGGRNSITSFEEWVEMDLRYIDNWSLWLDVKIIFKTIPAVLLGRGAK